MGSGTRSEKIRTYNYKDSRCTDHRLNTNFALDPVLSGEIEPVGSWPALPPLSCPRSHRSLALDIGWVGLVVPVVLCCRVP